MYTYIAAMASLVVFALVLIVTVTMLFISPEKGKKLLYLVLLNCTISALILLYLDSMENLRQKDVFMYFPLFFFFWPIVVVRGLFPDSYTYVSDSSMVIILKIIIALVLPPLSYILMFRYLFANSSKPLPQESTNPPSV